MKTALTERTTGVRFNLHGAAEINVWAPERESIGIKSNNILIPLEKDGLGYWKGSTYQIRPGDLYKVVVDEEKELPDPASLSQPEGVHGPSQAVDIKKFQWTDKGWNNLPLKDYVIYELHVGTFTPESTFSSLADKLDYLKELGITAIEIMPVAQFPGSRNWGYDGVFPYAVQNSYGGAEGLQILVNSCHEKGIAVILDVVYNHMGPEGNYLGEFAPYFTDKYKTPWGNAINFDDAYCYGVRQYFIENVLMWFRDFHIDALRMDAVHAIKDFSPTHILKEIKMQVEELKKITCKEHYLIVELDLNDTIFIDPLKKRGFGMNAQWIDEFHHALRVTAGEKPTGYYSDFNGIKHLAKSYQDAYVFDGQYSPHRQKFFGIRAENNPGEQFIVFSQNHDQVGNRMLGERTSCLVSFEMQKLLAASVLLSPYLPMLFMGEEYSEPHPFLYFVSHTDKELAEAVRKGRKAEFAAFHDQGEAPDPVAEETFEESKLQWLLVNEEPHRTMLQFYKALISLRKTHPILNTLDRKNLHAYANEGNTLTLIRWNKEKQVVGLMNFSNSEKQMHLPEKQSTWSKLLDSADPLWKGPKAAESEIGNQSVVVLQPESVLVYEGSCK